MNNSDLQLRYVSRIPTEPKLGYSERAKITYYKKKVKWAEFTNRLGLVRKCNNPDIRFCVSHEVEGHVLYLNVLIKDQDGKLLKNISERITVCNVLIAKGKLSFSKPPATDSKGIRSDRYATRVMRSKTNDMAIDHQ